MGALGDRLEKDIAMECIDALRRAGWYVHRVEQDRRMKKGFSDCMAARCGWVIFIEFKTRTGKQKPEQIVFANEIKTHGGEYLLCRGLEDITALFKRM